MSSNPISPQRTSWRSRIVASLLVALALSTFAVAAVGGGSAGAGVPAAAEDALDWITAELAANAGVMPGFSPDFPDWGLTADAALALIAGGRGETTTAQTTTDLLIEHVDTYSTWDDFGEEYVGQVRLAVPLAKILLVALAQGRDINSIDGADLEAELRSLMSTSAPTQGRFVDRNPVSPDATNGFGQSLAILALSYTDGGVPTDAIGFLLDQQCPNGGFRLFYTDTDGCESATSADPDTTAMAIQALLVAPASPAVTAAIGTATAWLISVQDAATGGFGGSGPTTALNANSTGLAGQALRAVGEIAAADRAAAWITNDLQLTAANAAGSPAAGDIGAIAYSPDTRTGAIPAGIEEFSRDQWRRGTTQAVLAIGLPAFGWAQESDPVDPTSTTTTTTSTTTTAAPTTSTTVAPTTATADAAVLSANVANSDSSSDNRAAQSLAVTGDDTGGLVAAGSMLLLAGLVVLTLGRRASD